MTPTRPARGRCHGRKCKPSPDRISPKTPKNSFYLLFVRKRKLNQLTNTPPNSDGSNRGKQSRRRHPDEGRQTKPRSRGRCRDQRRRIDPADHRRHKEQRPPRKLKLYILYIYSIYNYPMQAPQAQEQQQRHKAKHPDEITPAEPRRNLPNSGKRRAARAKHHGQQLPSSDGSSPRTAAAVPTEADESKPPQGTAEAREPAESSPSQYPPRQSGRARSSCRGDPQQRQHRDEISRTD